MTGDCHSCPTVSKKKKYVTKCSCILLIRIVLLQQQQSTPFVSSSGDITTRRGLMLTLLLQSSCFATAAQLRYYCNTAAMLQSLQLPLFQLPAAAAILSYCCCFYNYCCCCLGWGRCYCYSSFSKGVSYFFTIFLRVYVKNAYILIIYLY